MYLMADQFCGFLAAAALITLSPGPDNLMVLGIGISRGRIPGVVFGLGCALGCLSHTLLAALGVSALIAASPLAFNALKIGGGLYLLWLGIHALRSQGRVNVCAGNVPPESLRRLFAKGLFANAINPKVVIFFLSFLPQFVRIESGHIAIQTGLLGMIFTIQASVIFGLFGYFSGVIGKWLNCFTGASVWLDRLAGIVFVGLGLRLIASR